MPINHFTSQFYHHHAAATMFAAQNTGYSFNLNDKNEDAEEQQQEPMMMMEIPKEPLFEKPLTPSDVGKLNRLVIPKQHAEKYFPLTGQDSSTSGGLLLSFDDECGKTWRFRYSYWNSSQSYVLTKGWSRFVKEKRLDAGDVVVFERHRVDGSGDEKLFIGWRRRTVVQGGESGAGEASISTVGGGGWGQVWHHPYPPPANTIPYQPNCLHAGVVQSQTGPSGNSKRSVRLFGVNLEYEPDESEPITSSHAQAGQHQLFQYYNQVDVKLSRDVNQMRYQQG